MSQCKIQVDGFSEEELRLFEQMKIDGKVNVVHGVKEEAEVSGQSYPATVTCARNNHSFVIYINGPGLFWTVCPYCGTGGWARLQ